MPDGRFLSKSIAHDLELNTAVSFEADYIFTRCIPHLDVDGRMPGHPSQVKGMACPMRAEITEHVVDAALAELAKAELVRWYVVGGRPYLEFPGFAGNQKGLRKDREAASRIPGSDDACARPTLSVLHAAPVGPPDPPDEGASVLGDEAITTDSSTTPEPVRSTPDQVPPKVSQVKSSQGSASSSLRSDDGRGPIVEKSARARASPESVTRGNSPRGLRALMKLMREELHLGVNDDDCRRSGSILVQRLWGLDPEGRPLVSPRVPVAEIGDGIRGMRLLVDTGTVSGFDPGRPIGLRYRHWKGPQGRQLWDEAVDHVRYGRERAAERRASDLRRVGVG